MRRFCATGTPLRSKTTRCAIHTHRPSLSGRRPLFDRDRATGAAVCRQRRRVARQHDCDARAALRGRVLRRRAVRAIRIDGADGLLRVRICDWHRRACAVIATTRVVFIAASGKWRMAFAHTLTRARACNGARSTRAALAGGRARPFEALLGAAAPEGFCVEQEKCHLAFCSR